MKSASMWNLQVGEICKWVKRDWLMLLLLLPNKWSSSFAGSSMCSKLIQQPKKISGWKRNLQVGEICKWVKREIEVGEHDRFEKGSGWKWQIYSPSKKWNKFTRILTKSTNSPTTHPVFTHLRGCFCWCVSHAPANQTRSGPRCKFTCHTSSPTTLRRPSAWSMRYNNAPCM